MSKTQNIIVSLSLAAFVATILYAPWDEYHPPVSASYGVLPQGPKHFYRNGPIWEPPTGGGAEMTLRYGVMATWWVAIGLLCGGGLLITRRKSKE